MLMKHLTEACGRHRIAFIRGSEHNVEAKSRFLAWEDFCFERSLPHGDELVEFGDFTVLSGESATLRILEKCSGDLPDAFVVSSDRMALGCFVHCALNRSPCCRRSVVGFDDLEAESANPPLTTIRQPIFEMGRRAAEVLTAKLRKESIAEEHIYTPELVVRASSHPNPQSLPCGPPSSWSSSVFLESASLESLMPLLREPQRDASLGDPLARELETGLHDARTKARDPVGASEARECLLSSTWTAR